MKKCAYCNNKIRENAIFCDMCGKSLNNLKISYNKDFEDLLINIVTMIKKDNNGYIITLKLKNNIDLFWYYLFKYSKIEKILNNKKISFTTIRCLPYDICYNLKKSKIDNIYKNFIIQLEEYVYNIIQNSKNQEYTFNFLTNIDKTNISKLNDFIILFDLNIHSYDSLYEKKLFSDNLKQYHYLESLIVIKHVTSGKDFFYLRELTINKIHAFFGLLSIMENYGTNTISYHSNDLNEKHNLINYKLLDSSFQDNSDLNQNTADGENYYNIQILGEDIFEYKNTINKCIINKNYIDILNDMKNNRDVFEKLEEYLSLYYKASVDETLDGSFIKFWTLSEKIIKKMCGKMRSDKLLKFRKKSLDLCYPKYLSNRLDDLRNKRNDYVHEFKNEINQHDRNLAKLLSENLIIYILMNYNQIEKFSDYGILLEFDNQKQTILDIKRLF